MPAESTILRLRRQVSAYRRPVLVGVGVVVVAGIAGIVMGAPAILGGLGVIVVVATFAMLIWRSRWHKMADGPSWGVVLGHFALVAMVVLGIIQLVPYGRDHTNPPTTGEPAWASARTRELMVNACYGCHSNEVEWPWYSNFAPISWVVTAHVDDGRSHVNYSEFDTNQGDADETIETIREGSMPPAYYTAFGLHSEAKLSASEIEELVAGLRLTPGLSEDNDGDDDRDDDHNDGDRHEGDDD